MRRRRTSVLLRGLCLLLPGLTFPSLSRAGTLPVTNTNDSGSGSLRLAIDQAQPGDTVDATGIQGTIPLSAEIAIGKDLTILGPGSGLLKISGEQKGRVFNITAGTVALSGLMIANGSTTGNGGGIYCAGTLTVMNSIFLDNAAGFAGYGGGIYVHGGAVTLTNSSLSDNSARSGGGIANDNNGTVTIVNGFLAGNTASSNGGGIYNLNGQLFVRGVTFVSNNSSAYGGAIDTNGYLSLVNSSFTGNSAQTHGGAIGSTVHIDIAHTTFAYNSAPEGAHLRQFNQSVDLTHTLFATAPGTLEAGGLATNGGSFVSRGYNLDSDGTFGLSGTGDRSGTPPEPLDPRMGPLITGSNGALSLSLLSDSPAIDAGSPVCCTDPQSQPLSTDALGRPRIMDGDGDGTARADIGAMEQQLWIVHPSGGACTAAAPTCGTIQTAHDAALSGDRIKVKPGTYTEQLTIAKSLSLTAQGTVVVDAGNAGRAVTITGSPIVSLDGFTLTGGHADRGGAVYNEAGDLTLSRCTIHGNTATQLGGGIYNLSSLTLDRSTVSRNSASQRGGGLINFGTGTVTLNACTFSGNSAVERGGGLINYGSARLLSCTLADNTAAAEGGISGLQGTLNLQNTLLSNNAGGNCGGLLTSQGFNLSSDGSCGGGFRDLLNQAVKLGPLQDNGGPTMTHAFPPSSPAFNAGDPGAPAPGDTDQRGLPRVRYSRRDIGAVEMSWLPGDVNGNGAVDAGDVNRLLAFFVGKAVPTFGEVAVGDVRPLAGDGILDAADLNWVFRRFLGH